MSIRMSQDMGLHRDVDRWHVPDGLLQHEDKQTRKRCWAACLILDRYLSAYIGRPMGIQEVRLRVTSAGSRCSATTTRLSCVHATVDHADLAAVRGGARRAR